jgi:hypothetical protein
MIELVRLVVDAGIVNCCAAGQPIRIKQRHEFESLFSGFCRQQVDLARQKYVMDERG